MSQNIDLEDWLKQGKVLVKMISRVDKAKIDEINTIYQCLLSKLDSSPRLYLIVNEGVHPIVEDLKKQFGNDIHFEVVTRGNVELNQEAQVARRVKEIVQKHHGAEFVIVPSALPYLITVVYNTVLQITSKHPVYLQLDREKNRYVEKILDPRKLMV